MSAILQFPSPPKAKKPRKRGAQKEVLRAPIPDDRLRELAIMIATRIHDGKRQAAARGGFMSDSEALVEKFAQSFAESDRRESACFMRWLQGVRTAAIAFCKGSLYGIATDHYGHGGAIYTQAIATVARADVLHSSQRDEALALAVETLNAFGVLARFGGLSQALAWETEKGGDFATHAVADLGVTLAKLRAFGAMAGPTAPELKHAKQARARYSPGAVALGDQS